MLVSAGYDASSINLSAQQSPPEDVSDEIVLADGDVIRGRILSETEDEVVVQHPVFEELHIPRSRIVAIRRNAPLGSRVGFGEIVTGAGVRPPTSQNPPSSTTTSQQDTPTGEEAEAADEDPGGTTSKALLDRGNWSFVVGTAFGYVQNVNNELNVRLSAQAEHTSEYARLRIDSAYFLNSSNNIVIDNDVIVTTTQDWFFPNSLWSIFAKATYQWDHFEEWEHRMSGYVGPGYKLVDTPELTLDLRVGAGATYEYGLQQTIPEALVSFEWEWEVDDRQNFNGIFSYAPDLVEINQYRLSLNAEWNFRLQKERGLSFYVGVRNQFQSIVPEGSTNNDLRVFGGVKYEF